MKEKETTISHVLVSEQCSEGQIKLPKLSATLRETAAITGLSERTIRRLVARGLLKPSRATRKLIIPIVQIEQFLSETTHQL